MKKIKHTKKAFVKYLSKHWQVARVEENKDGVRDLDILYVYRHPSALLQITREEYINIAFSQFLQQSPTALNGALKLKKCQLHYIKPAFTDCCEYVDKDGNHSMFGELKLT